MTNQVFFEIDMKSSNSCPVQTYLPLPPKCFLLMTFCAINFDIFIFAGGFLNLREFLEKFNANSVNIKMVPGS